MVLADQGAEGERLAGRPVEILAALEHRAAGVDDPLQGRMDGDVGGDGGKNPANLPDQLLCHAGDDVAPLGDRLVRLVQARPFPLEPVGLVGQVGLGGLELGLEQGGEGGDLAVDPAFLDDAFLLQPRRIELGDQSVLADLLVHQRLGEARLVAFVMAEAAVAPHVDDDVALELLAELDGELAGEGDRLRVVAIDVHDRRLDGLGDVGRVRRRAAELRRGGEAHLVVDHEMDAPAGAVARNAGEAETFGDDALGGEGGVAVEQDGQHLGAVRVAARNLLGAGLAEHDRIDRLQMAGIGDEAEVHPDSVELAVRRGAEMIFDVARTADILGIGRTPGELGEDHAIGLAHHIGEDVEPAAMRHAEHELADAELAAIFDHRLERRDHGLAAVKAEALGADIFAGEEFLPLLRLHDLGEDGLLALGGEADLRLAPFHPFLQEAPLLQVVDVHIFEAEMAAIIAPEDLDELAHRRLLEAERAAEPDLAVQGRAREAVKFGSKLGGHLALGEAERIEVGGEMAAHPVGADQHHRVDRIPGGLLDLGSGGARARRGGFRLAGHRLDRHQGRVEALVQLIQLDQRPIGACPAGTLLPLAVIIAHVVSPSSPRTGAWGSRAL